ncbi:MAG: transcriptional repressor LexA [Nitrospirota bacterium]|nr:transcriptional repressor LexA [Nitrospirota bacterium]
MSRESKPSDNFSLSARERTVLGFIEDFFACHGAPPTMREIGAGCGIPSTRTVSDDLKRLAKAGRIRLRRGRSRGIEVTTRRTVAGVGDSGGGGIPLLGRIAAGVPLAADAVYDGELAADGTTLFGAANCFALTVRGDSMLGRHIVDGDLAVIRPQFTARDGDIVAAEVDGEVTLKIFRRAEDRVLLLPANDAYAPVVLDGSRPCRLLGVMVGLIRSGSGPQR